MALEQRLQAANRVPFMIRAWWLRDFQEYSHINWPIDKDLAASTWSPSTDPICDLAEAQYLDDR